MPHLDGELPTPELAAIRAETAAALAQNEALGDAADRRRAELGLLETSSLLRSVLDSALETSIIATNADLTIKVFNAGAERLFGYTGDEVIDKLTLMNLHNPLELEARCAEAGAADSLLHAAALVAPASIGRARDWSLIHKGGGHVTGSLVVNAMRGSKGDLLGYVCVARDVTYQRHYEQSLREATQKAEHANRAKSHFLANMSHEIRTPMNAVIGLLYLLGQTPLDAPQRDCLSKIEFSSKALLAVINDVLDLSKIEAGELILDCAAFSPDKLLRAVSDVAGMEARAKGIRFEMDIGQDLPPALLGDATRLTQILTNLLSNAVKFTHRGSVTLRVRRTDATAAGATLCFEVRDSGIGISAEAQAHLFAPFAQADASITRRYGGTGLGLSIVKSLARLLGGDVLLKSAPGVGSEFAVTLHFAAAMPQALDAAAPGAQALDEYALGQVRVLVVDDSDINLEVTKRILELHGARVRLARHGQEAFACLEKTPHDFDVVLMDVQMPVLDGYQATQRIRRELGLVDLPIVALTANALSSERQRAVAAGMNDFIIKPFDAPTLVSSIRRHVQVSNLQAVTPRAAPAASPAAAPWPVLDGIDSNDAQTRLLGDLDLFRSSLKRLIEEFSDIAIVDEVPTPGVLAAHAARMHKLGGSAGMMGADAIRRLAMETRSACVAGDVEHARELSAELAVNIQRLSRSAAPVLQQARLEAEQAGRNSPACDVPLQPGQLIELVRLLREQSLAALERFHSLAPPLRRHLGENRFEITRDHVDNLRFLEAAKVFTDFAGPA